MRSPNKSLFDIADAASSLIESTKGMDRAAYDANIVLQGFVIQRLTIIGEASKNLPKAWRDQHPSIPWQRIGRLRDKLIHHYFDVDHDTLWEILTLEVPELLAYVQPFVTSLLTDSEEDRAK